MNFTLIERLQLLLALTLALTTTLVGVSLAALVLGRLATSRQHVLLRRQPRSHSSWSA